MTTLPLFPAQLIAWGVVHPRALRWLLDEVIRPRRRALIAGHSERAREMAEALLNGGLTANTPVAVVQPQGHAFNLATAHLLRLSCPPLSPLAAVQMALHHRGLAYALVELQDGRDLYALLRARHSRTPWIGVLAAPGHTLEDLTAYVAQRLRLLHLDAETAACLLHQRLHTVALVSEQRVEAVWTSRPQGWALAWKA